MQTPSDARHVSIVMPAYRAERTLPRAARSVLGQTHADWDLVVVSDDCMDYEAVLARAGIADPRIRHVSSGATGSGSSNARNVGLDAADGSIIAILDADDAFLHEKLERALPHLREHGIVSTALRVETADGAFLRTVGEGADCVLDPGAYKFVNISMDSMLVYDRRRADPRYDPDFPCLTDIEFLLKLWSANATVRHLGTPLHVYSKQPASISNGPGAGEKMIATKIRLSAALAEGAYPLADPAGLAGLLNFYAASLEAERSYGPRLAANPGLLFEDHLEPFLAATKINETTKG